MVDGLAHGVSIDFHENGKFHFLTINIKDYPIFSWEFHNDGFTVSRVLMFENDILKRQYVFDVKGLLKLAMVRELKNGKYEGYMFGPRLQNQKMIFRDGILIDIIFINPETGNELEKLFERVKMK